MKTKKIWANLGVADLERTTRFYTEIGFKFNGTAKDLTSFTIGDDNFVINFFLNAALKPALKGELADLQKGNEIIFTLGAQSKKEVDSWEQEISRAGGNIISRPEEFGEGYYGFVFSDPDGHKYNVFFMEGI
ncbi:VOC family protein [Dyadobacter sp. CY312]|uniref:VOC family protein n=1 Tax=Dyadobacter sp. CY312 TaxID=2907303 RepID=UPI001F3B3EA0|nr:VOC family protein [Dyadobacter sp. CY312]MCE7043169.1 VOC family protein [Dyadobacter sp. CY312]